MSLKIGVVLIVVVSLAAIMAAQPPQRVRTIAFDGTSIAEHLEPIDQVVVIARQFDTVNLGYTLDSVISGAGSFADIVATVDVTQVTGRFQDHGAWISTLMIGRVNQLIRMSPSARRVRRGDVIDCSWDQGTIKIGEVEVRTDDAVPLLVTRTYLVFVRDFGGRELIIAPMLVTNRRLNNLQGRPGYTAMLDGMKLSDLVSKVKRIPFQPG